MRKFCLFFTIMIAASAFAGSLTETQKAEIFEKANTAFTNANNAADEAEKEELYQNAISYYQELIGAGIENSKLYFNIANVYLINDQPGRAILNYKRAQKLDESDTAIKKNLAYARNKCVDKVTPPAPKQVLKTLFFWHYDFGVRTRLLGACICFGAACIFGALLFWVRFKKQAGMFAGLLLVISAAFGISVAIHFHAAESVIEGVITVAEVTAYQGDGENYPPSFKEPLHEGLEFELLQERTGWYQIRLGDGTETWIPDESAELV